MLLRENCKNKQSKEKVDCFTITNWEDFFFWGVLGPAGHTKTSRSKFLSNR